MSQKIAEAKHIFTKHLFQHLSSTMSLSYPTHPFKQILVIAAMVDAIPHETEWSHVDEFYVTVKNRPQDLPRARQVPNVPWELVEEIK